MAAAKAVCSKILPVRTCEDDSTEDMEINIVQIESSCVKNSETSYSDEQGESSTASISIRAKVAVYNTGNRPVICVPRY